MLFARARAANPAWRRCRICVRGSSNSATTTTATTERADAATNSDNYEYEMYVWNVQFWAGIWLTHSLTQWLIYSEVHPSPWVFKLFAWDSPRVSHIPAGSGKKGTKLPPEFLGTYELLKILWVGPHRINVCSWILEPLKKNLNKFKQILKIVGVGCFFLFFFFSFLFFEIKNLVKTSWFPNGYLDEALLELLRTMFPKNVLNVLNILKQIWWIVINLKGVGFDL